VKVFKNTDLTALKKFSRSLLSLNIEVVWGQDTLYLTKDKTKRENWVHELEKKLLKKTD